MLLQSTAVEVAPPAPPLAVLLTGLLPVHMRMLWPHLHICFLVAALPQAAQHNSVCFLQS